MKPPTTPTKTPGFTPGPWKALKVITHQELGSFAPPAHYQIQAEHTQCGATLICELRPYGKDNDANARLIAQAPALFEALRECIEDLSIIHDQFVHAEHGTEFVKASIHNAHAVLAAVEKGN